MNQQASLWMIEQLDGMSNRQLLARAKGYRQNADSFQNQLNAPQCADSEMRAAAFIYNYTRWYRPSMSTVILKAIR